MFGTHKRGPTQTGWKKKLIDEYNLIPRQEESFWCKKSRLKLGHRNTKLFHQTAISRRKRDTVMQLKKQNGSWTNDSRELQEMACDFYQKLYSINSSQHVEIKELNFPHLSHSDLCGLNRGVSDSEIKTTSFQIGGMKSSGLDSVPACFYLKQWDIVGNSLASFPGSLQVEEIWRIHEWILDNLYTKTGGTRRDDPF